jgi:hypothetical protein
MQGGNTLAAANGPTSEKRIASFVPECESYELPSRQFVERIRQTRPGSLIEMMAGYTREDCDVLQ